MPALTRGISASFVSLLPHGTVSMAKLQGFFLERRGRPDLAIRDIKVLATSQAQEHAGTLALPVFLRRLGMPEHAKAFEAARLHTVEHIKGVVSDKKELKALGIRRPYHQRLLQGMMKGKEFARMRFALLDRARAEALVLACFGE